MKKFTTLIGIATLSFVLFFSVGIQTASADPELGETQSLNPVLGKTISWDPELGETQLLYPKLEKPQSMDPELGETQ